MTVKVKSGISLRRGDDIHFGTLARLGHGRMGITTDGRYSEGDFVEFQLELAGWDLTVTGIAEVNKVDIRSPRLNRFLLRILEMRRADRQRLQDWYQEQLAEAVDRDLTQAYRALDSRVGSQVPSRVSRDLPRGPQGQPTRSEPPVSNWGTDRALSISTTVEHQGSRRQALRAVLRAAYGDTMPAEPTPGASHEVADPEVHVRAHVEPMTVELRYRSLGSWRADWTAWMYQGLAFVHHTGRSPELEQRAMVHLILPDRVDLTCPARVVVVQPKGFGVVLDLDPHQHEGLRDVATGSQETPAQSIARSVGLQPGLEQGNPLGSNFWIRMFNLDTEPDPLDAAVADLVSPLAPLDMDDPRARRKLDAILARADEDYLVLCDQVDELLSSSQWRWPELEDYTRHASNPISQAAAFIVLAHITRLEAIQTLRKAAARTTSEPSRVEIAPPNKSDCVRCQPWHGRPTTPAALARRGLPPYHIGCQCRVVHRIDDAPAV